MLRVERDNDIGAITLDRPEVLNALSWELMDRLRVAIQELGADAGVRAVTITGAGRGFCAGADFADLVAPELEDGALPRAIADRMEDVLTPMCEAIVTSPVPIVAAVNGPCAGGGLGLALLADVTIAARSASFSIPHVTQLGIVPDLGISWALSRSIGRARTLGMSLLGERVSAEQAQEWGLIWQCVDDDQLTAQVRAVAARLASLGPAAVVATRALHDGSSAATLPEQLHRERRAVRALFSGEHVRATAQRFLNRTQPVGGNS
ncbi:enoyl-CoA hydratase/isomerase family protein [Candidatus Protofrankia californiensis]|uniref:enoyl-CoA hydratase/isomerase family protein n=1 Tax=Candidatus Protofrankia californiensis TaxID=1839754 RepID=UPI001041A5A8|nr:enoyl-CoA hydratase-related protein [Candidatus Protofrankia californiensis]